MVDYDDLYNKLVKNWPNVDDFIDKKDIISKTKSKSHNYNPNSNTKEFDYMALVMKSIMIYEYKLNEERIKKANNRIKKINQLGIY